MRRNAVLATMVCVILVCLVVGIYSISSQVNDFYLELTNQHQEYSSLASYDYEYSDELIRVQGASSAVTQTQSTYSTIEYRAWVLDQYFYENNSPLYGTGKYFVNACNKFGAPADCTTVAAIAEAETDLCKYHTSAEYHNCWGFGGGGEHRIYFDDWNDSISLVTERLVYSYGLKYMIDPSLMERTFCGWEPGCTNWGNRVKYFMKKISDYPEQKGFGPSLMSFR